jgi:acetyl-CoA synthetase (ADP-forming)
MRVLDLQQSLDFLQRRGFRVAPFKIVRSREKAVKAASKLGYPVVLKVVSKKAIHKTEVGGVKVDLRNEEEVRKAFGEIAKGMRRRRIGFSGILVQKHISGIETIIGLKEDRIFGKVVAFGVGGIWVEILQDISFRICPIDKKEALSMIREIKLYPIFHSRGRKVNVEEIAETIERISRLRVKELDINPYMVEEECWVVDARVLL